MTKGITILLMSGPMKSMEPNTALKLADAALNKGYKVNLFCYGEGVLSVKQNQAPKRFPNVGEQIKDLEKRGVKISVCETCSIARGLHHGEEIEGTKIGSLTKDFVEYLDDSDKLVTLAR